MCDFGVGAAIAIGAASAGANIAAQQNAASEQNKYRSQLGIAGNKSYAQNAEAVIQDVGLQIDQLAVRDMEQQAATRQELENAVRNARESGSTMRTATAAYGIEGRTVDLLHEKFAREVADFESAGARNLASMRSQASIEAQAIYARGQSAINGGYPNPLPPVATVSPATSIMNGVTTGLMAYGALKSFNSPDPGVGAAANPTTTAPVPYYLARPA